MTVLDAAYRRLARPVLFRLGKGDAETAHHRTLALLARTRPVAPVLAKLLAGNQTPRRVFGVDFPGAVGLAAGMDKDGRALKSWPALGFGHVEVGTVTAHAQPGNEQPRLFRLKNSGAVINRMGFNNKGSDALARTLQRTGPIGVPLGISLGKSKVTPVDQAVSDYLASLEAVHPYADYIAVNVSSPNTPGLRGLQDRGPLDELLGALTEQAAVLAETGRRAGRPVPVLVKIAPDLTDDAIGDVLQVCTDRGISGVIATNTTLSRNGIKVADAALAGQVGGLSGEPLRRRALDVVRFVAGHTELPVIGVGGISRPEHGLEMLDAGASLIQVYTGFIYSGPGLVTGLNKAIKDWEKR